MRRYALPVVFAFLLVVAGTSAGVVAGDGAPTTGGSVDATMPSDATAVDTTAVDAITNSPSLGGDGTVKQTNGFEAKPTTTFHIRLEPNQNAVWTVTVRYEFTDANETAAFEAVAQDFENGTAGPSASLYRNLADGAAEQTGREMQIESVERDATLTEEPEVEDESVVAVGTLELQFVWTNFLAQDGDTLLLGDVFRTPDNGTWLRTLEAHQTLVIETPEQYQVSSTPGVSVSLQENAVVIEGPRTFGPDEVVQVVYSETPQRSVDQPPWLLLAGAVIIAGLLIAMGLFAYRRFGENGGAPVGAGEQPSDSGAVPGAETEGRTKAGDGVEGNGGNGAGAGAESLEGGPANGGTPPAGAKVGGDGSADDLSLLSDTERVERLLERNGGRMRQADIVAETGWSDAKVSQLLSSMADEGRVEKLRLGRENLISLPEYGEDEESTEESSGESA